MTQILDNQIIDAIDASIYWKDLSGKYLGCNEYMAKMAGLDRCEIIGNTDYLLPWKEQANKIREIDLLVIANRKKYEIEENPVVNGGVRKVYLSSKSPLFDSDNNVIGVIGVSIDVTHLKRFEQEFKQTERDLDKYSTVKTRFLKNISHEARIPLGSVLSLSESLTADWDKFDDLTKRQNVELIFKETNRLSRFILNTFDISAFLNEEIQPEFKQANFSRFVRNTVIQYQKEFCSEKTSIKINHFDDYHFSFDHKLITRVINNLLTNAVQYSLKEKKITVGLYKTHLKHTEIPAIHFCITDEGVGIPENESETIFEPFTESSKTASKACGVGLGLSICKEIIELHAGSIWAENNLLKSGATFNFTIPTNLFGSSNNFSEISKNTEVKEEVDNILSGDLTRPIYLDKKEPFALIGISPFNSYFSTTKILQICEWMNNQYQDFAIFIPNEISRYTFEALGYAESRLGRKIRKQDNYTINKVNTALSQFYIKYPEKENIKVHTISDLKQEQSYQDLYHIYSSMFLKDKEFRENCLEVTEWVLQNNNTKEKIEEFQKNIAVQYFLCELPIMTFATSVLKIESCDFVYHSMPRFLKHLYLNKGLVSPKQRFLILR